MARKTFTGQPGTAFKAGFDIRGLKISGKGHNDLLRVQLWKHWVFERLMPAKVLARVSPRVRFMAFCAALALLGLWIIGSVWNADRFFTGAYQPVFKKAEERRALEREIRKRQNPEADSQQPRAPGMREADIEKTRGEGYSVY